MQATCCQINRDNTAAGTILHYQVDRKILDEEFGIMFQRLLIQRVQHRMTSPVSSSTSSLRRAFAVIRGHAAKWPLINSAVVGPGKRHAIVLKFDHSVRGLFAHVFDRVLIAEPVGSLDRVVHVPAPVIFAHVAKCCTDATLCGNGVTARWKYLGHTGRLESGLRQTQCCSQSRASGTDDDDVVAMLDEVVVTHAPSPIFRIA